ncbi:hypothetical protein J5837_09190 [Pseudoxanthomonas helianthi]|uniref:Nucleoside-diphosphate-sugar epimerase n=1 Tax=Pseudoxanthomonas helianthi TaxID=1453541 RepID=A0A940X2R1_9GAMM|nr:hypothetical protein [Pseudoxanthomonas helianthi]MBP3984590.1 hypothetical protein [Pseudoxanthomonas helianthi]
MAVLVIGASSQIGHCLLPRLLAAGFDVVALSRKAQVGTARIEWKLARVPDRMPEPARYDAIVSFGPLLALGEWLSRQTEAPAPRLVATSSMSAVSKRDSVVADEVEIARQLRRGEDEVVRQCERLGIGWTLFRPTLIYGVGLDKSLTPLARRALRWRVFPIPAARGLRQPVHADDLAQAVVRALAVPESQGRTFEFGGGERLSAEIMFRRVRDSLPRATLPLPLGRAAQALMRWLWPASRGPLSRLDRDLVADNGLAVSVLGISPRLFQPDAAMWTRPEADMDMEHR